MVAPDQRSRLPPAWSRRNHDCDPSCTLPEPEAGQIQRLAVLS
jgi:hypothetical protein